MSVNSTQASTAVYGVYEPSLDYQVLPGCRECGGSHPLARKPVPLNIDACPDCGAPAGKPSEVKTEKGVFAITLPLLFAQFCLWTGRKLGALYERL